jgi:Ca-activated chloride channel family protein
LDLSKENRVILISDAGLNTGITNDHAIKDLIQNAALEGIGLTAIGIGENFNEKLINLVAQTKGGNYLFANNGHAMEKFFDNFKFLVSPIAHHFKVSVDFMDFKAQLNKVYGIPSLKNTSKSEIINVPSLFFTSTGGGAIVLEFDL